MSMNIKKGDSVKILAGKDRGKTGKVLEVFPKESRVVVEGVNVHTRFSKPRKQGEKGSRLELPARMNVSKVMLICPICGKPTRVGREVSGKSNFRKCMKCGKAIQ